VQLGAFGLRREHALGQRHVLVFFVGIELAGHHVFKTIGLARRSPWPALRRPCRPTTTATVLAALGTLASAVFAALLAARLAWGTLSRGWGKGCVALAVAVGAGLAC
jgi:hypothetical protein